MGYYLLYSGVGLIFILVVGIAIVLLLGTVEQIFGDIYSDPKTRVKNIIITILFIVGIGTIPYLIGRLLFFLGQR